MTKENEHNGSIYRPTAATSASLQMVVSLLIRVMWDMGHAHGIYKSKYI